MLAQGEFAQRAPQQDQNVGRGLAAARAHKHRGIRVGRELHKLAGVGYQPVRAGGRIRFANRVQFPGFQGEVQIEHGPPIRRPEGRPGSARGQRQAVQRVALAINDTQGIRAFPAQDRIALGTLQRVRQRDGGRPQRGRVAAGEADPAQAPLAVPDLHQVGARTVPREAEARCTRGALRDAIDLSLLQARKTGQAQRRSIEIAEATLVREEGQRRTVQVARGGELLGFAALEVHPEALRRARAVAPIQ